MISNDEQKSRSGGPSGRCRAFSFVCLCSELIIFVQLNQFISLAVETHAVSVVGKKKDIAKSLWGKGRKGSLAPFFLCPFGSTPATLYLWCMATTELSRKQYADASGIPTSTVTKALRNRSPLPGVISARKIDKFWVVVVSREWSAKYVKKV